MNLGMENMFRRSDAIEKIKMEHETHEYCLAAEAKPLVPLPVRMKIPQLRKWAKDRSWQCSARQLSYATVISTADPMKQHLQTIRIYEDFCLRNMCRQYDTPMCNTVKQALQMFPDSILGIVFGYAKVQVLQNLTLLSGREFSEFKRTLVIKPKKAEVKTSRCRQRRKSASQKAWDSLRSEMNRCHDCAANGGLCRYHYNKDCQQTVMYEFDHYPYSHRKVFNFCDFSDSDDDTCSWCYEKQWRCVCHKQPTCQECYRYDCQGCFLEEEERAASNDLDAKFRQVNLLFAREQHVWWKKKFGFRRNGNESRRFWYWGKPNHKGRGKRGTSGARKPRPDDYP